MIIRNNNNINNTNITTTNRKKSAAAIAVKFKKLKRKGGMRRHWKPGLIGPLMKS